MENKKYWLRGLAGGIVFYILFLLITYILLMGFFSVVSGGTFFNAIEFILLMGLSGVVGGIGGVFFNGIQVIAVYILPIIPIGLIIGWIYGKTPKIAILISVLILFFMIGLEVLILKNTFYPEPYTVQPSIVPGSQY